MNTGFDGAQNLLNEVQAAQAMWEYYKVHKPQLVSSISAHRDCLLAQLMHGLTAEIAFAPFQVAQAPVMPVVVSHKKRPANSRQAAHRAT